MKTHRLERFIAHVTLLAALGFPALARAAEQLTADLMGFEEVPAISSTASGEATLEINDARTSIAYQVSYEDLEGAVQQAHIHFGQRSVNGGICIFLCTNLGNGPVGTPTCPAPPATLTGNITSANVTGNAASQGISATQFDKVLAAMSNGTTYVNVHSTKYPGGEIRGQLGPPSARSAGPEPWRPGALLTSLPLWAVLIAGVVAMRKQKASRQAAR